MIMLSETTNSWCDLDCMRFFDECLIKNKQNGMFLRNPHLLSQQKQEDSTIISLILEEMSLFSNRDLKGTFAVLREDALRGNVMTCFDVCFMIVQGIGCEKNWKGDGSGRKINEHDKVSLSGLFCEIVNDGFDKDCWWFNSTYSFIPLSKNVC